MSDSQGSREEGRGKRVVMYGKGAVNEEEIGDGEYDGVCRCRYHLVVDCLFGGDDSKGGRGGWYGAKG